MRVLMLVGRRASGKGLFQEIAKDRGIPCYEMSSVVFEWMKDEGIEINNRNTAEFSLRIRKEHGNDIVARRLVEKVASSGNELAVVSGVRSKEEVSLFRGRFKTVVLRIDADTRKRFERLASRQREQDPRSWEEFLEREKAEDELGLNEALEEADITMENNDELKKFKEKAKAFLDFISFS